MAKQISVASDNLAAHAVDAFINNEHGKFLILTCSDNQSIRLKEDLLFYSSWLKSEDILIYPDIDVLPYDDQEPSVTVHGQRVSVASKIFSNTHFKVVITSITAFIRKLPGREYWNNAVFNVSKGAKSSEVVERLVDYGYAQVDSELFPGSFITRPRSVDVHTAKGGVPFRMFLEDDTVTSIRSINPETMLTNVEVSSIEAQRVYSFSHDKESIRRFREAYRQIEGTDIKDEIYKEVSRGVFPAGAYNYTSLFEHSMIDFCQLFSESPSVILFDGAIESEAEYREYINKRHADAKQIPGSTPLDPDNIWMSGSELNKKLASLQSLSFTIDGQTSYQGKMPFSFDKKLSAKEVIRLFMELSNTMGKVLVVFSSHERIPEIEKVMEIIGVKWSRLNSYQEFKDEMIGFYYMVSKHIQHGFYSEDDYAVITEDEMLGRSYRHEAVEHYVTDKLDFTLLEEGDPVTHILYGVGRYKGLKTMALNGVDEEYLVIEYAEEAVCYVPVDELHMVLPYNGLSKDEAPLDKYGSKQWEKRIGLAFKDIKETVSDLKKLAKRKANSEGIAFKGPDVKYQRFTGAFPYQETPDQMSAISDIIQDMTSNSNMDRLVCGDVGFGKTEVAMRAAFLAANDGLQVVIMAPTTLLSNQHYKSFKERFEPFGINVVKFNGSLSKEEEKVISRQIESGEAQIIVSTSKVLKSARFYDLGLMIVDEEHRFGVKQKEVIYSLRSRIDLLSLSATPIPRSLSMSMKNVRDFSLIATPPAKRLSVKTFVVDKDERIIKDAYEREKIRNGQLFYVFNDLSRIETVKEWLEETLEGAKVAVVHGKMSESLLEDNMSRFVAGEVDVLLASTVIETGIDIPNANTIILDTSEQLGLSQMHQLRGRVGRGDRQAYCYVLRASNPSEATLQRYEALLDSSAVGQGYRISRYDLEIRGAGELLGDVQKGNISKVGYSLFNKLFVDSLRSSDLSLQDTILQTQVVSAHPKRIPPNIISNRKLLVSYYTKYAQATTPKEVDSITQELIDIYRATLEEIEWIHLAYKLSTHLSPLGCRLAEFDEGTCYMSFSKSMMSGFKKFEDILSFSDSDYETGLFRFTIKNKSDFDCARAIVSMLEQDEDVVEGDNFYD